MDATNENSVTSREGSSNGTEMTSYKEDPFSTPLQL